jgi:hypothetical protein
VCLTERHSRDVYGSGGIAPCIRLCVCACVRVCVVHFVPLSVSGLYNVNGGITDEEGIRDGSCRGLGIKSREMSVKMALVQVKFRT